MNFVEKTLEVRRSLRHFILGWIRPQLLASEKMRAELNTALKDHWKPDLIEVYELIHDTWEPARDNEPKNKDDKAEKQFIVFIDPDLDVDWIAKGSLDPKGEECVSIAESIGARRCSHLPRNQVLEFKRVIGQAIVNGIRGSTEASMKLAEEGAQFLKDRTVERSRSWTLASAHLLLVMFVAILTLFRHLRCGCPYWESEGISLLWLAIQGGVIGAYLSIVQKAGSGQWDAAAGRMLHFVEVFTRLFAGGVLGGVAFALSRSVHAPSSIKNLTPDGYSAFLFGVAAGLFERLIPKMISTYAGYEKPPNNLKK